MSCGWSSQEIVEKLFWYLANFLVEREIAEWRWYRCKCKWRTLKLHSDYQNQSQQYAYIDILSEIFYSTDTVLIKDSKLRTLSDAVLAGGRFIVLGSTKFEFVWH